MIGDASSNRVECKLPAFEGTYACKRCEEAGCCLFDEDPDAIPNRVQPSECPHGCKTPAQCLRYDQGGSSPADCLLEQREPHATRNREAE